MGEGVPVFGREPIGQQLRHRRNNLRRDPVLFHIAEAPLGRSSCESRSDEKPCRRSSPPRSPAEACSPSKASADRGRAPAETLAVRNGYGRPPPEPSVPSIKRVVKRAPEIFVIMRTNVFTSRPDCFYDHNAETGHRTRTPAGRSHTMGMAAKLNTALEVDEARAIFRVSRQSFVDPSILADERREIFDKCWLYLGHGSELPRVGDFVTRQVGGRSILFARSAEAAFSALLNTCPHRGAQVGREAPAMRRRSSASIMAGRSAWTAKCAAIPARVPTPRISWSAQAPACTRSRAARKLPRLSLCLFRSERRKPLRLSRRRQGISRCHLRSVRARAWASSAVRRNTRSAPTGSC